MISVHSYCSAGFGVCIYAANWLHAKLCARSITVYAGPDGSTSRKRLSSSTQSQSAEGSLSESTKRLKIGPSNNDLDMDKIIKDHFLGMNISIIKATWYVFIML